MNISKIAIITGVALSALALTSCSKVPAGNVGVKVYLLGSEKGVDNEVLGPGRYWIGMNEDLFLFPTFTQNKTWEGTSAGKSFTFQTKEGMIVGADLGLSYTVKQDKVSTIFAKYRQGIDEITDTYLRNMIRDALVTEASKINVESVYGEGRETLLKNVEQRVRSSVEEFGIIIERVYWIGQLDLPTEVVEKINAKVNADQITMQKQAEKEQSIADAEKKIEEAKGDAESKRLVAIAEAEANRVLSSSLTPELVQYEMIKKWNGELPSVTGSTVPMLNIDNIKK